MPQGHWHRLRRKAPCRLHELPPGHTIVRDKNPARAWQRQLGPRRTSTPLATLRPAQVAISLSACRARIHLVNILVETLVATTMAPSPGPLGQTSPKRDRSTRPNHQLLLCCGTCTEVNPPGSPRFAPPARTIAGVWLKVSQARPSSVRASAALLGGGLVAGASTSRLHSTGGRPTTGRTSRHQFGAKSGTQLGAGSENVSTKGPDQPMARGPRVAKELEPLQCYRHRLAACARANAPSVSINVREVRPNLWRARPIIAPASTKAGQRGLPALW